MKKMLIKILPFVLVITMVSCEKESDEKSKATLITQADWFFSKYETKTNNDPWIDIYPAFPNCRKDNKFTFKTNNVYVFDEGATKCSQSDIQSETLTWSFAENETKLVISGVSYKLEQLDESTLVYSSSSTNSGTKITFSH